MKQYRRILVGTIATFCVALATTAAVADPAGTGHGPGTAFGGMHGRMMGMGEHGGTVQGLMTTEEHQALREKMRNAKSPEERQALAAQNHAEMEKRAKEKGIELPDHRGPGDGMGAGRGPRAGGNQH